MVSIVMHRQFLLLALSALRIPHIYADATTVSTTVDSTLDLDGPSNATETECIPKELLSQKVSTCHTYQIATLNASPRRCIHIEYPAPSKEQDIPNVCIDFPNWFDGTNGCDAYSKIDHFCSKYGSWTYPTTPYTANQACCACGGGDNTTPRLRVGDAVLLKGNNQMLNCKDLQIIAIETKPTFKYVVRVMTGCGNSRKYFDGNQLVQNFQFPQGSNILVETDDPNVIHKYYKVELKKCRHGMKEQHFEFQQADNEASKVIILHKATELPLATMLRAASPIVNITQVWEDGLFDGSGDYFVSVFAQTTNDNPQLVRPLTFPDSSFYLRPARLKLVYANDYEHERGTLLRRNYNGAGHVLAHEWILRTTRIFGSNAAFDSTCGSSR